jgi:hypothetical protein
VAPEQSTQDATRITAMLVAQAQSRIELLSQQVDSDDAKAIGFFAGDIAAIGLLIILQSSLHRFWWVPALGFLVSAALFFCALWPREFALGPDLAEFFHDWAGGTELVANRKMLALLLKSIRENEQLIRGKKPWSRWGRLTLIPTAVAAAALLLLPMNSWLPGHHSTAPQRGPAPPVVKHSAQHR